MNLELRADQAEFQRQVAAFAAETVAPPAQAIDETNQFPRDIVQALASRFAATQPSSRGWQLSLLDDDVMVAVRVQP